MKLFRRISSILRIAWKQQVVLGRLALDVTRLVGEEGARRMDPLPARLQHGGHRVLRQPVDLRSGWSLRSSSAIAASRWAWPSPIGDDM